MSEPTKDDFFQEANEKIEPIKKEIESQKKKLLENAAVIISTSVIALSVILYGFNTGYCRVFNLPSSAMTLDIKRLVPLAFNLLCNVIYVLFIISSFKADRAFKKNRINYLRILWGSIAISHLLSLSNAYSYLGKWIGVVLSWLIPTLIELLLFMISKPKRTKPAVETEHKIVIEDFVEDSIFHTYYFKCGLFLVIIPIVLAPLCGEFCAKAEREYQTFLLENSTYAVIVDYTDKVLVQQACEQGNTLAINADNYSFFEKNNVTYQFKKYENVIINSNKKVSLPGQNETWNRVKEVLSMPLVTDWIMVVITLIYVVATCFICSANVRSAKASKAQLEEMKREHDESIRYGIMPFLQMEEIAVSGHDFCLELPLVDKSIADWEIDSMVKVKNIGNGAATNLTYTWKSENLPTVEIQPFPINAIKADGEYLIALSFNCMKSKLSSNLGTLILHYDDMRGYSYNQRMVLTYSPDNRYFCIGDINIDVPEYTGIKENA